MPYHPDAEEALEKAVVQLFQSINYTTLNAYEEINGKNITGRETLDEVVLLTRLHPALQSLNPTIPEQAITAALEQLTTDRSLTTLASANQQVYHLLRNGVKVSYKDDTGEEITDTVRVIDWNNPEANDWLVVQQLWVLSKNGLYSRRADLVLFVNGIPLVFMELKAFHKNVENAYRNNFLDYKDTIPHIFWYNAFVLLSNGRSSRVGSVTASWEHFHEWKRISDEKESGRISLETILLGTCEHTRLLDLVENFVLFQQVSGGVIKLVAHNHQYLGVNNAIRAVQAIKENRGRLGVFWHTQGSGKSFSMIFFAEKVMRKLPGNWTFVVVTEQEQLDNQIYKTFADVGAVPSIKGKKSDVQAQTGEDLRRLLRGDNRYVFTLIQKFHTRNGQPYPELSKRNDVIVMADEAHRSQYDIFAGNMRTALPNAAFIGFTGTPLIVGEEKTKREFGDYVSIYDFKQSVDDHATVPLHYEKRIPEVQLTNDQLNEEMEEILDTAMLEESEEARLEREFKQEYQVITRDNRQEIIARDIVEHFSERGFSGRTYQSKAMIISIDKLTAVRMYERVKQFWGEKIRELEHQLTAATDPEQGQLLKTKIDYLRETDMAVVISQGQNEIEFFREHDIDILPHRKRIVTEELDEKFKKPEDPFRMAFVCAMWMTGFDAPSCSTIYLDKPMRNHTLMQTIARANRVFKDKQDGLIVDYIGVFKNLEKALAIYGKGTGGAAQPGELPVQKKAEQIEKLRAKEAEAVQLCTELGIDLQAIGEAEGFDREALKLAAVETLLATEETRERFFVLVRDISRLFRSILPDALANEFYATYKLLNVLAEAVLSEINPDIDISNVQEDVADLLDRSVTTERYVIEASPTDKSRRLDLSKIDFDELKARFERGYKHIATEKLKSSLNHRLNVLIKQNRTRMNYLETYQQMLDDYNSGAVNVDVLFERLLTFVNDLDEEEKRGIEENLTEEELAIFDLLTRPDPGLSDEERDLVKKAAHDLLDTLRAEKLVLDWRKHQTTRADVKECIRTVLDQELPPRYETPLYEQKCNDVYQHVYEHYFGAGQSIYSVI